VIVVDASAVVAALTDRGEIGRWAEPLVFGDAVAAPHLLPVEVASGLRRLVAHERLTGDAAALAHQDLLDLPVNLLPYDAVAERVWELRHNVTPYDAWYVAIAELFDAPLATVDDRLAAAPGIRCEVLTPGAA
jgi:predicted nucleic acid-binding protein